MAKPSVRAIVQGLLATAAYVTANAAFAAAPVADEVHSWNIPAEDGPSAVRDFGIQSGVAISAVQTDLQGLKLNAVSGSMSVEKALKLLVAGTGLKYVYDASGRAVTLTTVAKPAATKTAPASGPTSTKADPPPTADDSVLLEEIVVTARKREENLQEVPISAEVISGQTLARYNIVALQDLSQNLPGIQLNGTAAGGQFFIRGIGSGVSQTFDQSVGIFIDDIFHGRTRVAEEAFLDLEQIEVLKGPQSTFFGNNAVAGALNITSAKPTEDFGGSVRALYGQFGQYAGEGVLNIPIGSDFAVRIAAIGDGLSGWATDPYAGHKQPDENNKAGRVTFLYRPSDAFDATLKIEGGDNQESTGSVIGDCPPPAPFQTATGAANPVGFCKSLIAGGYPTGVTNFRDTTQAGQGIHLSTFEDVLTLHAKVGEDTFTSVTGFYNYHFTENLDADATPLQLLNQHTEENYHQVSQEFRIASPVGQTIEWLAGVYGQEDHLTGFPGDNTFYYQSATVNTNAAYAALRPYLPLVAAGNYEQEEHSYAVFGSLDWNVTDQLKLGTGLRGTWDYKAASSVSFIGTGTSTYGGVVNDIPAALQTLATKVVGQFKAPWNASGSYNSVMPSAEIDYKIVPKVMLYATYSRGFLAGTPTDVGYVFLGTPVPPIKPEHVNAYEAGIKSNLFDDHLRLNFDVFRSNYSDLQVSSSIIFTTPTGASQANAVIDNAGSSRSQGVELSGEWIFSGFRFQTAVTYLDTRYLDYPGVGLTAAQTYCAAAANKALPSCVAAFPHGVPLSQNLGGQATNFAPTWSGSETVSYTANLPHGYHFITEADVFASTTYFFGNNGTNDPEQMQAGYARLDGRLSFESPDSRWAVDVILKNLTDKVIVMGAAGGTGLPTTNGSTLLQIDQPRNVAIQARYQW